MNNTNKIYTTINKNIRIEFNISRLHEPLKTMSGKIYVRYHITFSVLNLEDFLASSINMKHKPKNGRKMPTNKTLT